MKISRWLAQVVVISLVGHVAALADPQNTRSDAPGPVQSAGTAQSAAQAKANLLAEAQKAIQQELVDLKLTPSEKKLFDTEVSTDPLPFVTNYSSHPTGIQFEIDRDKLKEFLKFSAQLFTGQSGLGSSTPQPARVCLLTHSKPGCESCENSLAVVRPYLTQRLEQRGFNARQGLSIPQGSELTGERAFEYYSSRAAEGGCDGLAFAEVTPEKNSSDESEEESGKIKISLYLSLKSRMQRKVVARSSMVIQSSDLGKTQALQSSMSKSLADAYAQASRQSAVSGLKKNEQERYVKLQNVKDFFTYAKFKDVALNTIPGLKLEERFVSPGQFRFAISSEASLRELSEQLRAQSWEPQQLTVVQVSPEELVVELR
ncbi:MAG: hypothetical protein AB1540_08415 [Bdellovibrionota bacterium]